MKKENQKKLLSSLVLLIAFAVWTMLAKFIDVKPIGPDGTRVGFASINGFIHKFIGVNMTLYTVTDWLGLVPIIIVAGFAMLGLIQLIRRKSIFKVDKDIILLGGFYIAVFAMYLLFENVVIN